MGTGPWGPAVHLHPHLNRAFGGIHILTGGRINGMQGITGVGDVEMAGGEGLSSSCKGAGSREVVEVRRTMKTGAWTGARTRKKSRSILEEGDEQELG
eukprot:761552-Hanusia_phi.AAC.5